MPRTSAPVKVDVDLEKAVTDAITSIDIPEKIAVSMSLEKNLPKLCLDASYLRRILSNLVLNAIQAMPDGGKLIVASFLERGEVLVTVADTGVGISEEVKPKLFTPLFTTKSKGQGFGLAVIKKLTESLGGTITFESAKGKGTKFTLKFPISQ